MKQIAACLLVAAGIGGAGYCADEALVPLVTSCFDANADMSDLTSGFIPDWHFKKPNFPKPCLGFCPEMENWP
jgi:hypothetical protein